MTDIVYLDAGDADIGDEYDGPGWYVVLDDVLILGPFTQEVDAQEARLEVLSDS